MSPPDTDSCVLPSSPTINILISDYIAEVAERLNHKMDHECEVWNLGLSALRKEWEMEHKNLVFRYESSEREKATAKVEVDKHFETINGLQARMDKLSENFITKTEFKSQIDSLKAWITGGLISLIILLVAVIVDIMIRKS